MATPTQAQTHERDIPSITTTSSSTTITDCFTDFSFCLATSLAIAKRLTWEQTPWTYPTLPLSSRELLADHITLHTPFSITADIVSNALILSTTYRGPTASTYPQQTSPSLLVVFPHLRHDASRNPTFLKIWHDEIVRPAFNMAWADSGLVSVWRKPLEGFPGQRIKVPHTGERFGHEKMARESTGILKLLENGRERRVFEEWPSWVDANSSGSGGIGEGIHTTKRRKIYTSAWKSITGMLHDHPQLAEFQDPILVAVHTARADVNVQSNVETIHGLVGRDWDQTVDSKFVVPGTFKVEIRSVVGDDAQMRNELEKGRGRTRKEMMGVQWKRVAEDQGDAGKKAKRARKLETVDE